MKNHRISTTLSEKHWNLLKKYSEEFKTQQKTLEYALECLENSSQKSLTLTLEEKYWMRIKGIKSLIAIEKTAFKLLIETANIELLNELFIRDKIIEYTIEFYFQKSIKECSLKEVIEGLVINLKITNWVDTADFIDGGNHYKLILINSLGFTFSKLVTTLIENVFETYGVMAESIVSIKTIFIKIFKI
ncbi:MAG: hypothetical protein NHB15_05640 [Methanosarcina barkeri]|nr:hypothetical protein [Methanosarcina sp. ERenArc_MAG2]